MWRMILDSENFDKALRETQHVTANRGVNNVEHIMTTKWRITLKGCKQGRELALKRNV